MELVEMDKPSTNDEILGIVSMDQTNSAITNAGLTSTWQLLTNLKNAAATFGEGTPPVEDIRTTIEEHVRAMKASGDRPNLTAARRTDHVEDDLGTFKQPSIQPSPVMSFGNLAFRPKTGH